MHVNCIQQCTWTAWSNACELHKAVHMNCMKQCTWTAYSGAHDKNEVYTAAERGTQTKVLTRATKFRSYTTSERATEMPQKLMLKCRVVQNRIFTPDMTVSFMKFPKKSPCIHVYIGSWPTLLKRQQMRGYSSTYVFVLCGKSMQLWGYRATHASLCNKFSLPCVRCPLISGLYPTKQIELEAVLVIHYLLLLHHDAIAETRVLVDPFPSTTAKQTKAK
jgi:hypothetical protein